MESSIDETRLKELLKAAIVEVLSERRDLIRDLLDETIEDIAIARAIEEGENTEPVSREQIFNLLEGEA